MHLLHVTRTLLRAAILAGLCCACAGLGHACFYSSYKFNASDEEQTNFDGVIYERYDDLKKETLARFRTELQKLRPMLATRKDDPAFLDDFGFLLVATGEIERGELIWKGVLQQHPDRFETLCNLATLQQIGGRLDEAYATLSKVADAKPELRGGAEQWHLRMLDYLRKQRQNHAYGSDHLFIDELTPVWKGRSATPPAFNKVEFPIEPVQGVTELVRQFPNFGEGWLVLGMLMENQGDNHRAKLAYVRADKAGNGLGSDADSYIKAFAKMEEGTSKVKQAGYGLLKLAIILGGGYLLFRMFKFVATIINDRIEARRSSEGDKSPNAKP